MKLAIFIPAHNEEKSIASVVLLSKKHGKVFVIDDGSGDNTAKLAKEAGATVIAHRKRRGYGAAIRTGLLRAKKMNADAFVFIDGDFQHDPLQIPLVAKPVADGKADLCIGSRFLGSFVKPPAYRREGVMVINKLAGVQAGEKNVDYQCGFRAFSKKAATKIRPVDDGYGAGAEIVVRAQQQGLRIAQVPVSVRYYEDGGGSAIARGAGLAGDLLCKIARAKPLVFFLGAGFLLLVSSVMLGLFVVNTFYATGELPIGSAFLTVFTGIAGLVLALIGINLYTLGALLERKHKREHP